MYTLVKGIGVLNGINQRWHIVDFTTYLVKDLYTDYRQIYLTLETGLPAVTHYIDFTSIKPQYAGFTGTLAALLIVIGDTALTTIPSIPTINVKTAKFKDAHRAMYHVTPIHPVFGVDVNEDAKTAVMLTREMPVTDYSLFHQKCLVSVNGLFHLIDTDGLSGVLVYDAMKSLRKSNQNQIGIYSFLNLCNLTYKPITVGMIHKQDALEDYSSSMYFDLGVDTTNKTVMLVAGGYLHTPDNSLLTKINNSTFKLDFSNYPLLDRYYESTHYLDLTSLGLNMTDRNPSQVALSELTSDAVLVKYMTMSQSFFVILDTPEVYVNRQAIKKTGLPGMYISYKKPEYPIVVGLGRMPEYWSTTEDGQYSLTVYDNTVKQRIYNTTNPLQLNSASDSTLPTDPEILVGAQFLEIGRDI